MSLALKENLKIDETCFHCGEALPAEALARAFKGEELKFCCNGCRSVCSYIFEAGLEGYYEKRDKKPGAPFLPKGAAESEDPDFVKKKGGVKEACLIIEGIHCSACIWLIEKVMGKMEGVRSARLNYSTHKLRIEWDASKTSMNEVISKISSIGYGAAPFDNSNDELLKNKKDDALIRVSVAGFGTLASMFLAEGLYGGYLWGIDEGFKGFLQWASLLVSIPVVFYSGLPFIKGAYNGLRNRAMTMDMPIAAGALITFFYSVWATVRGSGDVYFDSAVMFIFFILIGRYLEAVSKKKAAERISRLTSLETTTAVLYRNGLRRAVPLKSIIRGDIIEIRPGDKVPLDGVLLEGASRLDEAMLTGESRPVEKGKDDLIWGGTLNLDGSFLLKVTEVGGFTRISRIKRLIEDAELNKTRIQKMADKIAGYFIPAILSAAVLTFLYWTMYDPPHALVYAVTVLIITCPCALALATPAAILAGSGRAAREGVLIKNNEALELVCKATHIVFDKTGTLTEGRMSVTDIVTLNCMEEELLTLVAAIEQYSEHPIGKAICAEARKRGIVFGKAGFKACPGKGVKGVVRNTEIIGAGAIFESTIYAGSSKFMRDEGFEITKELSASEEKFNAEGKTVVYVAREGRADKEALGLLAVSDPLRAESREAVSNLKSMGLRVTILSGDKRAVAEAVGEAIGVTDVVAELLPEDKEKAIRKLKAKGEAVIMVGDGVNDGPALAASDIGIAMGSGTDLAISSADIVLLSNNPLKVVKAIDISRKTFRAIKENLWLSVLYNLVFMPLAAFGFIVPVIAAVAMPLSSLAVIGNSIRNRN
ncbi:MAG: heavy metal translocating P-type ATPase [Deltaproteobacteria bacterium]|nr:heavy metal translocating P-type ATPase [Deltaproteobacteria bacterium]